MIVYLIFLLMLECKPMFACFSIVHLNSNPCSQIKVIIANNRDEDVFRPTNDADYWPDDLSYIYGGRDLVRKYSTWLSMNTKNGRIGNLLFLAGQNGQGSVMPSGSLVAFYLHSNYSSMTTTNYINEFYKNGSKYRGINLLLIDYMENGYWKLYYTNNNETDEFNTILQSFVSGTIVISNNLFARPFQKVLFGEKMFNNILERYEDKLNYNVENPDSNQQISGLIDDIMYKTLQNRTFLYRNGRDQNLQERFLTNDELELDEVSAINANYTSLWTNAQTRTNTIILVLGNGTVVYTERTLKFDHHNSSYWSFNNRTFNIESLNSKKNCKPNVNKTFQLVASLKLVFLCFLLHALVVFMFNETK